jgi:hypothetical protein
MPARKNLLPIYPMLEAKITEYGVKKKDIASALGITARALSSKLTGRCSFTLDEALTIKQMFFPNLCIEELFSKCDDIAILNHKVNKSQKRCELIAAAKEMFDKEFEHERSE